MKFEIVIGSNYGDEGKGMCVSQLTRRAKIANKRVLNVLYNGGPQRGHTVDYYGAERHVYHHFGSGTLDDADTYCDDEFMVNPMVFVREFNELTSKYDPLSTRVHNRTVWVHPMCRVTTPWDMMANQILEIGRTKDNRHGTCGHGIWETRCRYDYSINSNNFDILGRVIGKRWVDIIAMSDTEIEEYLCHVKGYFERTRLKDSTIPKEYEVAWNSPGTVQHFIKDIRKMQKLTMVGSPNTIYYEYDTIIYEGGQGLALDFDADPIFATASKTGTTYPLQSIILHFGKSSDIDIYYVTRKYFTRHGEGILPNEIISTDAIIEDITNIHNQWQGTLRVAKFDKNALMDRISKDFKSACKSCSNIRKFLFITHLNEELGATASDINELEENFEKVYTSDSKYRSTIVNSAETPIDNSNIIVYNTLV